MADIVGHDGFALDDHARFHSAWRRAAKYSTRVAI